MPVAPPTLADIDGFESESITIEWEECAIISAMLRRLEVALDRLDRPALAAIDQFLCLGDAIRGGPQPAEVAARLRALGCPVVMGNADAWLLSGQETRSESIAPERLRKVETIRQWSLAQLSATDQAWIAAFQATVAADLGAGRRLLGFHGSPASFDDMLFPTTAETESRQRLGAQVPAIMAGGHVHLPFVRRFGETFFFNRGSVGFAYNHEHSEDGFRADPWPGTPCCLWTPADCA